MKITGIRISVSTAMPNFLIPRSICEHMLENRSWYCSVMRKLLAMWMYCTGVLGFSPVSTSHPAFSQWVPWGAAEYSTSDSPVIIVEALDGVLGSWPTLGPTPAAVWTLGIMRQQITLSLTVSCECEHVCPALQMNEPKMLPNQILYLFSNLSQHSLIT